MQRHSVIDHVYVEGVQTPQISVSDFTATDHRVAMEGLPSKSFMRSNLKRLSGPVLCLAIDPNRLTRMFQLDDVDKVHDCIVSKLRDAIAPHKQIITRVLPTPLANRGTLSLSCQRGTEQLCLAVAAIEHSETKLQTSSGETGSAWHRSSSWGPCTVRAAQQRDFKNLQTL